MLKSIEWIGVGFALLGAFLVASEIETIGYILMLISSGFLTYHALKNNMVGLLTMQLIFGTINAYGIFMRVV